LFIVEIGQSSLQCYIFYPSSVDEFAEHVNIYPLNASDAPVLAIIVCLSACVSVTCRYWLNIGSRKQCRATAQGL